MKEVNPKMIFLAREARGLTQQELANKTGTNKTTVSRLESGDAIPSEDMLYSLSSITGYPLQFFFQKGDIRPVNLAYRKRQHVPSRIISPIEAQINIMRMHTEFLIGLLGIKPPFIPAYEVSNDQNPAVIARRLRKEWKIETPVIENLTQLLEEKNLLIQSFDFGTERVDSKSILTADRIPVVFLNSTLLGDRQRFSLAYELGHLVMHSFSIVAHERNIGHEANEFVAEFLMPAEDIVKDFKGNISIALLGELKRKWKVSMIALLYRADDLGLLTPNQKRYLLQQFNQLRIRRREPTELDVPQEYPVLVRKLIENCRQQMNIHITGMANLLSIQESEYLELYGEQPLTKTA